MCRNVVKTHYFRVVSGLKIFFDGIVYLPFIHVSASLWFQLRLTYLLNPVFFKFVGHECWGTMIETWILNITLVSIILRFICWREATRLSMKATRYTKHHSHLSLAIKLLAVEGGWGLQHDPFYLESTSLAVLKRHGSQSLYALVIGWIDKMLIPTVFCVMHWAMP